MFCKESIIFDFSVSETDEYKVVISGFCIEIYRMTAATAVKLARSVGNARLKPGCSMVSLTLASACVGAASKLVR